MDPPSSLGFAALGLQEWKMLRLGGQLDMRPGGADRPFGRSWGPQPLPKGHSFSILSLALGLGSLTKRVGRE